MVPDVFASFGRTLCRGALIVDPSSYGTGFSDGLTYGFGQGWSTGYSFGYSDGGDDEDTLPINVPIGGALAGDFGAGFATGYPYGYTDGGDDEDPIPVNVFPSAPAADQGAGARYAAAAGYAGDLDEADDAGFARGLSEGFTRAMSAAGGPGGGTDATPPTVTAVSPTPNTTPGAVGGMPSAYGDARQTPIVIRIEDVDGAADLALVQVTASFLDNSVEVVYRAGAFGPGYVTGSTQLPTVNGVTLSIRRTAGWPAAALLSAPLAVTLLVDAVDGGGNAVSVTLVYHMPLAATFTAPAAPTAPGAIDLLALSAELVVWQLR